MRPRRRRPRKNAKPFIPTIDTEQWLATHPNMLIDCPNQPGGLKLTQEACAKRYEYANDPRYSKIGAEPFNVFVFKMNLVACRNCSVGVKSSKRQEEQAA